MPPAARALAAPGAPALHDRYPASAAQTGPSGAPLWRPVRLLLAGAVLPGREDHVRTCHAASGKGRTSLMRTDSIAIPPATRTGAC